LSRQTVLVFLYTTGHGRTDEPERRQSCAWSLSDASLSIVPMSRKRDAPKPMAAAAKSMRISRGKDLMAVFIENALTVSHPHDRRYRKDAIASSRWAGTAMVYPESSALFCASA
jgi:hypothetical protein